MIIFLRSLIFNIIAISYSIMVLLLGAAVFLHPSKKPALVVVTYWCRSIIALARVLLKIKYKVEGIENVKAPCVVASQHQSTWETLIFHVLFTDPAMIMKSEIAGTPMTRAFIKRLELISVRRKDGSRALIKMIEQAKKCMSQGRVLVIFPEGTRVAPGQKATYQKGVAALYKALQVPVVPMALNSGLFWGRRAFLKKPGTITLRFLPPIMPGETSEVLLNELSVRLERASVDLLGEANQAS